MENNAQSTIESLLAELEAELDGGKRAFFSDKSKVDAEKCLEILDELRERMPGEMERASNIMKERRQIIIDAENEAQHTLDAAQKEAERMVSETEIVHQANDEAACILDRAKQNAREIRLSAKQYAIDLLGELKSVLKDYQTQTEEDLAAFNK